MSKVWFWAIAGASLSWALWASAQPRWETLSAKQLGAARVRISGGWFVMGSDDAEIARAKALCTGESCKPDIFAAEQPAHRVYVRAFAIDRTEVSNAAYQRCVNAGRCAPTRGAEPVVADYPVVQLTFLEAREYCRFAGGDLPTEAQWEFAARGSSARSFPWGPAFQAQLGAFASADQPGSLRAVAANPDGKSFFGLLNMAGNVWEFVLDAYRSPYDGALPNVDPVAEHVAASTGTSSERVLRGGSWLSPPHALRARYRAAIRQDEARADVGLRCAYPAR